MTIYTKTGDSGQTDDGHGGRMSKNHPRAVALGEMDELNAHVGLCVHLAASAQDKEVSEALRPVQGELMTLAAEVSTAPAGKESPPGNAAVTRMEHQIDAAWAQLPPLEHLVVPGGCVLACQLHIARTICRRAERAVVAPAAASAPAAPEAIRYLNRLGDLLFALARLANFHAHVPEQTWGRPR